MLLNAAFGSAAILATGLVASIALGLSTLVIFGQFVASLFQY